MRNQLFALWIVLFFGTVSAATDKVVCYYGSWTIYRPGKGKFNPENINPNLCTHIIYGFVGISSDGSIRILDQYNDIDLGGFRRFNALRTTNPNLKTLVAIGGWNEGSTTFSQVAGSQQLRTAFVNNAVEFVKTHGFDGFDLDWEYPGQRGGSDEDKANFVLLLKEFRVAFDKHNYLLTAAVAAAATPVDISYDVPAVSEILDFVNVMAYDLHGSWEKVTGINAPLYPSSSETTAAARELNVVACIQAWLTRGAKPSKLVLGIGVYGRSFLLANAANPEVGAPVVGPGNPGPYTGESGMLGYNEICELQLSGKWTVKWSNEQQVPYAYSGNQWVGYDNPRSVSIKVDYAKQLNLGGLMIWSVETDDFQGICGSKYPILTAINSGIGKLPPPVTSTSGPTVSSSSNQPNITTPKTTVRTTTKSSNAFVCETEGYFRDPIDCSKFYYCQAHNGGFLKYDFQCAGGLLYDPEKRACDYKENVQC